MDSDDVIAAISVMQGAREISSIEFQTDSLTFRCQRCAVFCCKLGGPRLSAKDIQRLEKAGFGRESFLVPRLPSLVSNDDGSCVFLISDDRSKFCTCSAYESRPTFCRLYPFRFEKTGPQSYALKLIPCCSGLNSASGQVVNEAFFDRFLRMVLFDLIDSGML